MPAATEPGQRIPATARKASNLLLLAIGAACLLYIVYSLWAGKSDLAVRLAPAAAGLCAPLLLFFPAVLRMLAAALIVGTGLGLYTAQILSMMLIDPDRPALQMTEEIAKQNGVPFDGHTQFEEIQEFRERGIDAYPSFYPYHLLEAPLQIRGQSVVPIGSISNALTVCCNEGGQYLKFTTDEHGFPNPPGAWTNATPADIAFVGASSAVGEAVPVADNLLSQLQTRYRTVTVGAGGNGPLLELASIREYLDVHKPKRVLWMFSESHTPEYLEDESRSALLRRYLDDPNYKQGLLERQPDLDRAIRAYFEEGLAREAVTASWKTKVKNLLLLQNIRTALYFLVRSTKPPVEHVFQADLYEQVLREGQRMLDAWGGELTIVYFPDSSRYAGICNYTPELRAIYDRTHDQVMAVAQKIGAPVIDLSLAFPDVPASEAAQNMPYFYPYPAHYTPEGYHRAGQFILQALAAQEAAAR